MEYGPFREMAANLENFIRNSDRIAIEEARKDEKEIINLQDEQFEDGLTSEGVSITPPYSFKTIQNKIEKHQPFDRVTLKDEGDFRYGLRTDKNVKSISIDSKDKKTKELTDKYGDDIFGLNPNSLEIFRNDFFSPRFIARFKNLLLG